jgi:acyl-CoA dehydrogenase
MNFTDTPEQAAFRAAARCWIRDNAPWAHVDRIRKLRFAGLPFDDEHEWLTIAKAWQRKKYDAGWACLVWPAEYGGRGLSPSENVIFQQEEGPFAELFGPFMIGQGFVAPTLMAFASEAQKRDFLPPLASGEHIWCQMFSEPGAGSDLAGVRTRAERCEGGWRLNGQKVWTSGAHHSEWGIALVRTDVDALKHKGLTMFIVDMSAPGLTVRPIKQLSGSTHFNEVFFDDVLVADEQCLGAANEGWGVALTTLMSERMSIGASTPTGIDEMLALALKRDDEGAAAIDSEDVRLRLADWYAKSSGIRFGVYRMLTALARGGAPGPEAAVCKLVGATATQEIAAYGLDLLGARGRAADDDEDAWLFHTLFAFGAVHRLEGGTDEVLRNILAERVLGLPPDIRADRGPFRDIPTARI